jgi:hypothetical protein
MSRRDGARRFEVFRRPGFRTRREIDREKYAPRLLRDDFHGIRLEDRGSPAERAETALHAAEERAG